MTTARSEAFPNLNRNTRSLWVNHTLCIVLSLVFLTAAIAKTQSFHELEATLAASRLLPVYAVPLTAVTLLALEYMLSVLILVPATRGAALNAATILLSVFLAYSLWRWLQGISVPCHCFGILFKLLPWQSITLNLALLSVSAIGLRIQHERVVCAN